MSETRFPHFPRYSSLDKVAVVPLEPFLDLPPNPPQSSSVAQLRRLARVFRLRPTGAERWLWELLRGKQLTYRFRRQYVIPPYIVDFYCPKFKLIVEIDGPFHHSRAGQQRSNLRDDALFAAGYKHILHFKDSLPVSEMFRLIEDVLLPQSTAPKAIVVPEIQHHPQPFPPRRVFIGEWCNERDPKLMEILAERNPPLADLLAELKNRKRMA